MIKDEAKSEEAAIKILGNDLLLIDEHLDDRVMP